jgi:Carboxypeptidase regulatory-like domain/TonB dependent receptor-like, beta-barrel
MRGASNRGKTVRRLAVLLGVVAVALIGVGRVAAQVSNAEVHVLVNDVKNLPLPGVTVQISEAQTGLVRVTTTDEHGMATLAALPPGTYKLSLDLAGFNPIVQENFALRVGQTARVNATMQEAQAEKITVTAAAPVVDVLKMDSSTNIVPEQIQQLPVPDRDFERLAFIAPGVQRERGGYRFITNGPDIGSSGNASQTTIMVDGVDFTDEALGLARARVSQDAIREFRVIQNRFDTEIGGSAGGALSIVTRSGTNTLSGSVFGFYRADRLRAAGALDLPCGGISGCDTYSRGQYGFTIGGPIVKDKTHFFASLEYIKEDNIVLFRPGGAFTSTAADIKHPFDQTLGFASIDHSFSDSQRLDANLVYERYREDNFHVGGLSDESWGNQLNRDNWNLTFEHTLIPNPNYLNELHVQIGNRRYDEPTNSNAPEEWFSVGNTLKTGTNTTGHIIGDGSQWEISDTAHLYTDKHNWKMGFSFQHIKEESAIPTFENGTIVYYNDTRALPIIYFYGVGSADSHLSTNLIGVFVQDDWRPLSNFTLSYGLRWDLDTNGNDPGFHHPLVPNGRSRDTNNYQPRLGFSWDVAGDGRNLIRGGVGRFTGRFLLVPAFAEQQQNGVTGRKLYERVSGILYGLPPSTYLDPNNLSGSGILLAPAITLLAKSYDNPYTDQATLGWTTRLGNTGMYFDAETIYDKGHDEIFIRDANWNGNPLARPNPAYSNINTYTNDGHSEYKALVLSLNGTIKGGHLITASVTLADKKNLSDDFSPVYTAGYPNDPSNPEGEWGRSQSDERFRVVLSGVFNLGWGLTVAPIVEYGSGQPWTKRLGYDYNVDGFNSDRAPGVPRNGEDGPPFRQVNLRVTKGITIPGAGLLEIIVEGFNIFNTVNYDVNSINSGQYLQGPTITSPTTAYIANPLFGKYSATLPAREVQLALRYSF